MPAALGENRYGKSRVRLVRVTRHGDRHDLADLMVSIRFEGDFAAAHADGDNRHVLPTDTMKNTVYALAKNHPVDPIEEFAIRLARHFLEGNPPLSGVVIGIRENLWTRIPVGGSPHRHAFNSAGAERRTTRVAATRDGITVHSGIDGLVVLKTTGSGFAGFHRDALTTLPETSDRILATRVRARWEYWGGDVAWSATWAGVRRLILETFATQESPSVQHTAHAIGQAVIESFDGIRWIRLAMPNLHCLLVDLKPFGLENRNEIFVPVDEPHGLIEATVVRQGGSTAESA